MCKVISQGVIKIRPLDKKTTAHPLGLFTLHLPAIALQGCHALHTDEQVQNPNKFTAFLKFIAFLMTALLCQVRKTDLVEGVDYNPNLVE